jgi:Domain of unknown function (DUF3387)
MFSFRRINQLQAGDIEYLGTKRKFWCTLDSHGYPRDNQEKATQTVLEQAELLCADWAA